jgi:23S rRNA (guanosine2251-2'-O)-methyltransferase
VAAKVGPYPWVDFAQLLPEPAGPGGSAFFLALDGITDPQNLGAIARTALCAGVDGIVTAQDRSAPPTPAASKASAGALEHIRVARVPNLVHALRGLKDRGLWVGGMVPAIGPVLFDIDLTGPLVLVVGGEEKGIRPLVRRHCDFLFCIPQAGPLDSLNASVACGVVLYEAFRQRRMR